MAVVDGVGHRGVAVVILNVDVDVLECDEEPDCAQLPFLASLMESSSAVVVCSKHVGILLLEPVAMDKEVQYTIDEPTAREKHCKRA